MAVLRSVLVLGAATFTIVGCGGGFAADTGTSGGASAGGAETGGAGTGGVAGGNGNGGVMNGGTHAGGHPTGGNRVGGSTSGGRSTGGAATGGFGTGGAVYTGGATSGGIGTGGTPSGGTATGGQSTGGTATGGTPSGGTATGGLGTGGASHTGGNAGTCANECGSGQICDSRGACVPDSVVVIQVGDEESALTTAATAVVLRRFGRDGTEFVGNGWPVRMPTAAVGANQPLTLAGTSNAEGALSRSANSRYLTLAGYAALPGTAAVGTSAASTVHRVVARVDASARVDTTTQINAGFDGSSVRGATTLDGTGFWVCGNASNATGGVHYALFGAVGSTQILATPGNTRVCGIGPGASSSSVDSDQLYASSGSGTFVNVFTVGTGLPTTAGQTATSLPGLPVADASPYGFVFFDRSATVPGVDTLYLADDRAIASGGGIQKWTFDGATWSLTATLNTGLTTGVRGLAAFEADGMVTLFATTTEIQNNLVAAVDDGTEQRFSYLVNAPANTVFRGVAPMPRP